MKKFTLGKKQQIMVMCLVVSSTAFYYANFFLERGGEFSEGILVGFLLGITFIFSLGTLLTFLSLLINIIKSRWQDKK